MISRAPTTSAPPEELEALVIWAVRAARARAATTGLHEHELVSAALHAVDGAVRSHEAGGAPLAAHVRNRVRFELLDAVKIERRHVQREPLFDALEEALPLGVEDDDIALARAAGVDALVTCSPEETLLLREARQAFDREVARLPREAGRLYELHFRQGLGRKRVAAELGISERTVANRVAEICARLTAALRAYADED